MESDKLFESMKELWQAFEENHISFKEKGNKAAFLRAYFLKLCGFTVKFEQHVSIVALSEANCWTFPSS